MIAAFAAVYIIWGSTYLAIRFAIETIPPFLMAGVRFTLAGAIIYTFARLQKTAVKSSPAEWRTAAIVGGCLLLGGNGGVAVAEQYVSSGLASVMVATVPIYIALLGWAMGLMPRPRPLVWLGLAGGFAGVAILVAPALNFSPGVRAHPEFGMLILLLSALMWSIGSLYSRMAKKAAAPLLATAQQMLCGGAMLLVAGVIAGETHKVALREISAHSIWAFVYLVVIGALVGYSAYTWLLRNCEPAKVATYAYVNPIVAVLLGALFAGETLTARAIVAAALIIGSVAIVITADQFKSKPAAGFSPVLAEAD